MLAGGWVGRHADLRCLRVRVFVVGTDLSCGRLGHCCLSCHGARTVGGVVKELGGLSEELSREVRRLGQWLHENVGGVGGFYL